MKCTQALSVQGAPEVLGAAVALLLRQRIAQLRRVLRFLPGDTPAFSGIGGQGSTML